MNNILQIDIRAVSPVVGSILLAGIVVVLVSVVASPVVFSIIEQPEPSADFKIEQTGSDSATVTFWNGNPLDANEITILVNGETASDQFSGQIRPGAAETIDASSGDTIRVVWVGQGGTRSAILSEEIIGEMDETPTPTPTPTETPTPTPTETPTPTPDPEKPTAVLEIKDGSGQSIDFDASESEPSEQIDEYRWDLNNDGTIDRTTEDPTTSINCPQGNPDEFCGSDEGRVVVVVNGSTDEATASYP